jgi:hypothetical protein
MVKYGSLPVELQTSARKPEPEVLASEPLPLDAPPDPKKERRTFQSSIRHSQCLAKYASSGAIDKLPEGQFQLTLVGAYLKIKDELTVYHLDELCKLCRQERLDLAEHAKRKDGPTERMFPWLTTWCGFQDWAQVRDHLEASYGDLRRQ